jgi:hypothetical protein
MWLCRLTEAQIFALEEDDEGPRETKESRRDPTKAKQTQGRIRPSAKLKTKSVDDKLKQLLERCVTRAKELHNQHLYSLSSLALAKYNIFHATSRPRLPGLPSSTANMVRLELTVTCSPSVNSTSHSFCTL